jgi:hypothetical protein
LVTGENNETAQVRPAGPRKARLADKDGNIRDLSKVIAQIDDQLLARATSRGSRA